MPASTYIVFVGVVVCGRRALSCALRTPPSFMVTSPEDTAKSALLNVATPLLAAEASSAAMLRVPAASL